MRQLEGLGNRVRVRRINLDMTQIELAEKCHVMPETIGLIERGKRFPSIDLIITLAEALRTTTDSLLIPPERRSSESMIECIVSQMEQAKNKDELICFLDDLSSLLIRYFSK